MSRHGPGGVAEGSTQLSQLNRLNDLNQLRQVTGLVAPVTGLLPGISH